MINPKFIGIALIIILIVCAIGYVKHIVQLKKYYEGPEALQWLKNNKNPYAFASNHFTSTKATIDFVEKLYSEGAQSVNIAENCINISPETLKEEGGPYADGMVVKLPSDKNKRKIILNTCNNELDSESKGNLEKEVRFNMIFLWWD